MNSKATITALGSDLDSYFTTNYSGDSNIQDVEYDYRTLESLANDGSINNVRIAIVEQPENILSRVQANSAYDINQAYLVQLFYVVPRKQDYDSIIEFDVMDIKDHIFDWVYNIDAGTVTSNELLTLEWDGISRVDRQDDFSLLEINLGAFRQTRL